MSQLRYALDQIELTARRLERAWQDCDSVWQDPTARSFHDRVHAPALQRARQLHSLLVRLDAELDAQAAAIAEHANVRNDHD